MALEDYRQSGSWKAALELAPKLVALAEDLPASEEMGLSYRIKQILVDLPASAAHDQLLGTDTRQIVAMRLMAVIDLIDRVYPALDTADTRAEAEQLAARLIGDGMPKPAPEAARPNYSEPAHSDAGHHETAHHAEPSSVPVVPSAEHPEHVAPSEHTAPAPSDESAHHVSVAVQPASESSSDVHPDSAE